MKEQIIKYSQYLAKVIGASENSIEWISSGFLLLAIIIVSFLFWWITRKVLILIVHGIAAASKTMLDDYLIEHRFFAALANLVPLLFVEFFLNIALYPYPNIIEFFLRFVGIANVIVVTIAIFRGLNAVRDTLKEKEKYRDKPIESYFQLSKILIGGFFVLLGIAIMFNLTLSYLFTGLSAMTAVILLIFKDSILGFVGSVQLASNDMIRIGDWITMEKFGADGNVTEINLTTVKVQNFDKTITTIPTYSLISDAFKNWRGMEESEGRRIARSVNIRIQSIKLASSEDIDKWSKVNVLNEFIEKKKLEIEEYNANLSNSDIIVNSRKQTNIGLYRKYLEFYLKSNEQINQNLTLLVRQLPPEENGVPLQIYCFTHIKDWGPHEEVMADIFDHIFATISYFDLEIYEKPSSKDFKSVLLK